MAEISGVGIDGVALATLEGHDDERGTFFESYRKEWFGAREMVQSNLSVSSPGVLRGLHFHRDQADYWLLTAGSFTVALYDVRAGSPSQGRHAIVGLRWDQPKGLYIPPGVAHGFYTETGGTLTYLVDAYFTGDDEHGILWNDPALGIDWPRADLTLSRRDRENPPLAQVDPPAYRP